MNGSHWLKTLVSMHPVCTCKLTAYGSCGDVNATEVLRYSAAGQLGSYQRCAQSHLDCRSQLQNDLGQDQRGSIITGCVAWAIVGQERAAGHDKSHLHSWGTSCCHGLCTAQSSVFRAYLCNTAAKYDFLIFLSFSQGLKGDLLDCRQDHVIERHCKRSGRFSMMMCIRA